MGLLDRDWYWQRRAERKSPDDDYLFPHHRWPGRKTTVYPTALAVLAVLAFLVFGLHQGWFDGDWRSHAAKVEAENKALRAWESERPPAARPPNVATPRPAPHVATFYAKHRVSIDFALLGLTILSPFVLLGLLIGLFISRLRGPAVVGLVLGIVAANAIGSLFISGSLLRFRLLPLADGIGGVLQVFMIIIASFTIAAIAGAIAMFVFTRPRAPSNAATVSPRETDERPSP